MIETRVDADAPDRASPSPTAAAGDAPRTIGRFTVLGPIGQGGMGIVVRAVDPQLRREVAIKLLRPGKNGLAEEMQARLLREARAMAALSHPNVVPIYEVGEHDGSLYIAMQFIAGANMRAWLKRERPPWRRILGVFRAAGRGLAAAHAAGLVHRDFKPANVIVGDDGRVRVVDFGLARTIEADRGDDPDDEHGDADGLGSITRPGMIVGTPAYMAPEQFSGTVADARADQYGFCVAFYEALYGRLPFAVDEDAGRRQLHRLLAAKQAGRPTPPPTDTDVPLALWDVLARGLQPDAARRYAAMPDLLRELRRISESESPPTRRSRKPAIVIALVVLAVLAVVLAMVMT